eukprot:6706470-Pyramimonas_sp.AAC.1
MCVPSAVVCSTHYLSSGVLDSRKGIAKSAEFGWPENHMRTSVAAVFVTPEQEFRAGSIIRAFQEVFYTVLVNEGRYKTLAKLVPLKFVCRQEFVFGLRRQWRRPPKFEGLEGRHEGRGSLTLERACRMSTGPLQDLTSTCPWKGSGGPTLRMPSAWSLLRSSGDWCEVVRYHALYNFDKFQWFPTELPCQASHHSQPTTSGWHGEQISKERVPVDVEIQKVKDIFRQINTSRSGKLDRGEIQRALNNP